MIFIYILLAVLLFGLLVAVHEFGHFITAKLTGVKVNEFAIGMGPAIFKKQVGETLYALRILPFGGYCAMEGENGDSEDERAFSARPIWARLLIVIAGSLMNLIAGFLVLFILFIPVREWATPTVDTIVSDAPLSEQNLMPGDTVKEVDGYKVYLFGDIQTGMMRGADDGEYDITVIRDGEEVELRGLRFVQGDEGENTGARIEFKVEKTSFFGKIKFTFQNGTNLVRLVFVGLSDLLTGGVSKDDMAGPVGIGKMMADTAKESMPSLWYLLAFISINLGVMNLLPIPALDGGRLLFILLELIFRKPVPQKFEGYVHVAGFVLLMLLMVFITYNDIVKIFFK